MWNLGATAISALLDLPETGMGFQLVEAFAGGMERPLLIFNSEQAFDLSDIQLENGDDPATILRNGLRIVELLNSGPAQTFFSAPQPHSFRLLGSRIFIPPISQVVAAVSSAPQAALPSSLVKHVSLTVPRTFHRFSAFHPDRRVDPLTGGFFPGTYAAPQSEVPFVPTGFTAVGRFALPNNLPASHHYEIDASAGTSVDFGTVAPAFGQAGGGVEAYFQMGAVNAKTPLPLRQDCLMNNSRFYSDFAMRNDFLPTSNPEQPPVPPRGNFIVRQMQRSSKRNEHAAK